MSDKKEVLFDLRKSAGFFEALYAQSPLSIWASLGKEHNYRVVYWNEGAEKIYGIPAEEAIGQNYLDLFVADEGPQVRRDSENDCDDIILNGTQFINYMAVDNKRIRRVKSPEHPILLLTNVFRVFVEGQGYQVEMAVDVTSSGLLKYRRPEFRQLKQVVGQIEKEMQLIAYDNINTINDKSKLEKLILDTITELSEAEAAIFAVPGGPAPSPLDLKRYINFSPEEALEIQERLRVLESWRDWEQEHFENSYGSSQAIVKELLTSRGSQYIAPILFSDTVFGAVVVFHPEENFFDIRKKEAIKSFLLRVSGLYEVSTKFDFNRNWRLSLAHELLSQADKVNKALQEFAVDNPDAELNEDLQRAKNAIQQQLDLATNIIAAGKDHTPSEEALQRTFGNVVDHVEAALSSYESNTRDKQQTIQRVYTGLSITEFNELQLIGEPEVVDRVMRVIFSNATKYGPLNSTIQVYLSVSRNRFLLKVVNEGRITPELLKNAFQHSPMLLQGSNKDGAHVGLHVSRGLTRSFNGEVTLANIEGEDKVAATLEWPLKSSSKEGNDA